MGSQITTPPYTKDFGAWEARSNLTVYQEAVDGFCLGFGTLAGGSDVAFLTDGSNPPTWIRIHSAAASQISGICCPVKAFDYWEIMGADGGVWWIPLEP